MAENNAMQEESKDQTSSADTAVCLFLKEIAVIVVGVGVPALLNGKVFVFGSYGAVAILFLVSGIYWPRIKLTIKPRFANYVDRIANDSRYRKSAIALLLLYPAIAGVSYVINLRHDLDTYVMPRVVTRNQADHLQKHLSAQKPHSVIIRVNRRDDEARQYSNQLLRALRRAHWTVTLDRDAEPHTLEDGLCLHEVGIKPKNDSKAILQEALTEANNYSPNCSGPLSDGEYNLFILVGHRPFELRTGRIRRLGQILIKYGR